MSEREPTLLELRDDIASRRVGAEEAVRASLERVAGADAELGAFLQTFPERALARAREIDGALARAERVGPLAGVPVAVKDNICTREGRTTCASRILEGYRSPFDATAVARLERAGAVVVGKTNLDEFAMGSSGENSAPGPTRNPWDTRRVPGGSSSGSAAAVAARLVPGALGSDTGGSIRQPGAYCGVVGLKPTYARVSRWGLVAFASSLDQIGPLAATVDDAGALLQAVAGHDPLDSTSADVPVPDLLTRDDDAGRPVRLGVPAELTAVGADPDVLEAFDRALAVLRDAGAETVEVALPRLEHGVAAYYLVAPAEASANLARYDGVRYGRRTEPRPGDTLDDLYARSRAEGFGPEVKRRIMLGTYALSAGYYDQYYAAGLKTRRLIKADLDAAFGDGPACDAILTPTAPTPAFRLGEKTDDPVEMYRQDVFTVLANLAGIPAISVPMGFVTRDARELPVGLQIMAPAFEERRLLAIARRYEAATRFADRAPEF